MRVYVLMTNAGTKEAQPVGVTDNQDVADQFYRGGTGRDWVPLDLNDLSLTDMGNRDVTGPLKPKLTPPLQEGIEQTTRNLDRANRALEMAMRRKKR